MRTTASNAVSETIRVYDEAAPTLARHMSSIGSRIPHIERAFELAGHPEHPNVIEIGCGDGRDARDIVPRSGTYTGFDPSVGLITLARERDLGRAEFYVDSALTFDYAYDVNVIFAFASLLHLDRTELRAVFERVADALTPEGVLYITLKQSAAYERRVYNDDFELPDGTHVVGHRVFYYYSADDVLGIAEGLLRPVLVESDDVNGIVWLTVAFTRA